MMRAYAWGDAQKAFVLVLLMYREIKEEWRLVYMPKPYIYIPKVKNVNQQFVRYKIRHPWLSL